MEKSPFSMGKSTISMAMFNSYLIAMLVYQRVLSILGISAFIERCLQDMSTLSSNARDEIPKDSPHQMDKALRLKNGGYGPKRLLFDQTIQMSNSKGWCLSVHLWIFEFAAGLHGLNLILTLEILSLSLLVITILHFRWLNHFAARNYPSILLTKQY